MSDEEDLLIQIGLSEKKYLAALARIEAASTKAAKGAEQKFDRQNRSLVRGIDRANQSASAFANGGLKQIGMQLSQVAQQGAVTGSYLQALTVQAADIGLAFGAVGIAAGALISVLGPMAINMFGVGEEADDAGKAVEGFVGSMKNLQALAAIATSDIGALKEEFGDLADEVQRSAQIAARAALSEAMSGMGQVGSDLTAALQQTSDLLAQAAAARAEVEQLRATSSGDADDLLSGAENALDQIRSEAEAAASAVGLTTTQAMQLHAALLDVGRAKTMQDVAAAAFDAQVMIDGMFEGASVIPPEVAKISDQLDLVLTAAGRGIEAMDEIGEAAGMTREEVEKAAVQAANLASAIGGIDFSNALAGAQALSKQLGVSLHQAMQIMGLIGGAAQEASDAVVYDPRDPRYDAAAAERGARLARVSEGMAALRDEYSAATALTGPGWAKPEKAKKSGRKSKGGGRTGGLSDEAKADRDALREVERYVEKTRTAVEEYHHELAELQKLKPFFEQTGNAEAYARAVAQVEEEFRQIQFAKVHEAIESVSDAMASAIVNGEDMGEALRGVFQQIAQDLIRSGIQQMLMGLIPGGNAGGGGIFGKIFAGFFDGGGSIPRGQFGIAGENGPEIIRGPAHVTSTKDTAKALGGGVADVRVFVDQDGNWQAAVERIAAPLAVQTTAAGLAGARRNLPGQMQSIRARGTSK